MLVTFASIITSELNDHTIISVIVEICLPR